jgi:aminoglycoside phosphotransferase
LKFKHFSERLLYLSQTPAQPGAASPYQKWNAGLCWASSERQARGVACVMTTELNPIVASDLAVEALGCVPTTVRRFGTGTHHHVFDVAFKERAPVVVRIAAEYGRPAMAGAYELSRLLRPKGVPLPKIIVERLDHQFPHLILERLPGADLGHVIRGLSDTSLEAIAARVATAQVMTSKTVTGMRYGYGVKPINAPHEWWSQVLQDNLARSRRRIAAAGLFDQAPVHAVAARVAAARSELDALPPIPFLHDTTTKNVIVTPDGTFSGIVDVDDLCFGDPRYVAALTLASLVASGGPTHYVDAWMNLAGYRCDRIFRLYVALFIVDFMSEHGQAFNGNVPPSTPERRSRLLGVFAEQLRLMGTD